MANVGYATLQIIPSVRGIGNELRRQLVAPAGDAGGDAGEAAGGGFADSFKGALAAIGVAEVASKVGEQFADAFNQSLEQGHTTKVLQGQLGSSGPTAKREGAAVGKLFAAGVTENFEQGAEAIREVVRGGLVKPDATIKQLDSIGTKMVDVATVFGTDMNLQGQAVSAMLKNKLAPDATAALDLITVGFQKLGPNAEDLLETFQEYPVQLKKLGLDARTAMGLFSQGIQGGARDTDIIADAMKEFSIRAIDMSQGSQDAYKAIGLNAEKMSLQIAKGGTGATAGLQTVLDTLREIDDPVKREAAAVGLFGTQAEELGTSLFKLDPGKARSVFGDVAGAADQLGETLRSGPSHEIKVFTRALKQGLVDFIGGQVLPLLGRWGGVLNREVLPPIRIVGGVLASLFLPTLHLLGAAISGTVDWLREWGVWLIPLGIAVAGLTIAMNTQAIAVGLVTAVFSVYRAAILVGTAVTQGFAAAQAFLSAVMQANPIVLVITAIIALGAALVIAYQKSETFRSIVDAAWSGIKAGFAALWSFLQPAFALFMVGLRAIGAAASWLWGVLGPVFGFIWTAIKVVATIWAVLLIGPWILGFKAIAAISTWLWSTVLSPFFTLIAAGVRLLWAGVKSQFALLMAGIRLVGSVFSWLWTNAVRPVLGWIADKAVWLWTQKIKPAWDLIKAGAVLLGAKMKELWSTYVSPALQSIGDKASWLWNNALKPAFDLGKKGLKALADSFGVTRDNIKTAWDAVTGIAKKPIAFLVNTIYNDNLVPTWNAVAGAFGAPKLSKVKGFATGGRVFGAGTETSDDVPAWLSKNEHVWTAKEVRGAGGHGAVMSMRKWAAAGGGSAGTPGFATGGGLFDWVKGTASKGVDLAKSGVSWLKDGIKASAESGLNSVVRPLLNKISGSASLYRDMITRIPKKMISSIIGYSGKADKELEKAGFGGKGFASALSWARTQAGKKYQWGGNGNPSWDCSGFMSAIESVIRGQKPHRRWATGAFSGSTAPGGWVLGAESPFQIGITNAGVGHTAGTLQGVNVESRGGDGVVVGSRARSYMDPLFTHRYGLRGFANGGSPRPGEIAWVGENGPELIEFSGGEVVYSHPDSMAMASALGPTRGFAKGTSSATRKRARGEIPGDLKSLTSALAGTAGDLSKALAALVKDIKTAGLSGKALSAASGKAAAKLLGLAKAQDAAQARLDAARTAAADQKKTAADFLGIGNLAETTSVAGLITGMQDRQKTVKTFESQVKTLSRKGLSQDLISQLVAMGPDSQLAGVVAGASKGQISQLNQLAKSGASLSTSYGRTMADAMFDAGKDAGRGFLAGLIGQEKALQAQMNKLGKGMVSAIRKALDSHSPSRETEAVGADTGAGLLIGVLGMVPRVESAAAQLGAAAIPSAAALAAQSAAAAAESAAMLPAPRSAAVSTVAGSLAGQRVRLVVSGREFDAYLEEVADGRVDAALTTVRRTVRNR
ncbi:phage tail tape measure protein [Streptomyces sp. NPDC056749]|uniref:phage tail tape measure protein n=1 Tax=Streptomyces sp. NPDC056749 TaxID=3345936 RepID=UPI0036817681